jgi:hypothetical protein
MGGKSFKKLVLHGVSILSLSVFFFSSANSVARAALDSSFSITVPNSGNLVQGCSYAADIKVNAGSNLSNSADIIIDYDPAKIEIIDSMPNVAGTQIKSGLAYEAYFGNQVDTSAGKIRLTGGSFTSSFTGDDLFATIQFKGKPGATNGSFVIYFTGAGATNTYDSNIAVAQTSQDSLGSVTNASFNFAPGSCVSDSSAPAVMFITPANGGSNIPVSSPVKVQITDNLSGVNISTLEVLVNGVSYTPADSAVVVSGTPNSYSVTVKQKDAIFANAPSSILVKVSDFTGNVRQSFISFNFPSVQPTPTAVATSPTPTSVANTDKAPPVIEFVKPVSRQTIGNDSDIVLKVSDEDTGISLDSLQIVLNDKKYTINDVILNATGAHNEYLITIRDSFSFSKVAPSYLTVFVADKNGNVGANNMFFNVPAAVKIEDENKNNQQLVCTPVVKEVKVVGIVENPPLENQVAEVQTTIEALTPAVLRPAVRDAGVIGIASLLSAAPTLARVVSAIFSLLAGGLVVPFFKSLLASKDKKYGYIIDDISREKVALAVVEAINPKTSIIAARCISNLSGRFYLNLEPGFYRLILTKKGYESKVVELDHQYGGPVQETIELIPSADISVQIQFTVFNLDPKRISLYFASVLALLNMLYVKTFVSILVLVVVCGAAAYFTFAGRNSTKRTANL